MNEVARPRWSGQDKLSLIVAMLGLLPALVAALAFALLASRPAIDEVVGTLLSIAGVTGVPVLVFGTWMCWRRVGRQVYRVLAVLLGAFAVTAWPLADVLLG